MHESHFFHDQLERLRNQITRQQITTDHEIGKIKRTINKIREELAARTYAPPKFGENHTFSNSDYFYIVPSDIYERHKDAFADDLGALLYGLYPDRVERRAKNEDPRFFVPTSLRDLYEWHAARKWLPNLHLDHPHRLPLDHDAAAALLYPPNKD